MNNLKRVLLSLAGIGIATLSAQTTFTSLHVYGDGVCTTTDSGGPIYYGNRYSNGRVWVEVLAEWQGIPGTSVFNTSFFGHISGLFTGGTNPPDDLLDDVASLVAPPDASTALFVVWVSDADFAEFIDINFTAGDLGTVAEWTTNIGESIANHESALITLYGKGARTLVLPLAVDITSAPAFNFSDPADNSFVRARVLEYNVAFQTMVAGLRTTYPDLTLHVPDTFSFFDSLISDPASFASINPLQAPGTDPDLYAVGIDEAPLNFEGPGADYIFWDDAHPTGRVQMHLADLVQKMITPAKIAEISAVGGGAEVDVANVPVGRAGTVESSDDLFTWVPGASFTSTSQLHTETVSTADDERFFRVAFPVNWVWP